MLASGKPRYANKNDMIFNQGGGSTFSDPESVAEI